MKPRVIIRHSTFDAYPVLDPETRQALEFDALLQWAAALAQTPVGKSRVLALQPLTEADQVRHLQRKTTEARRWVEQLQPSFAGLEDPSAALVALGIEQLTLGPAQILLAAGYVQRVQGIRSTVKPEAGHYPLLWSLLGPAPDLGSWVAQVRKALDAEGNILDSASAEIRDIRAAIGRLRHHLNERLQEYFRYPEVVQDTYITERNGRYVIPVRADRRQAIDGVLHGTSSSGATVFLEPLAVVNGNNELASLLEQEANEVQRILGHLTDQLRSRRDDFRRIVQIIEDLDATAALGRLSLQHRALEPELESVAAGSAIRLTQARHPMLIHFLGWEKVVPVDLQLSAKTEILIISGPNAGGKTAALKMLGLLAVMAQCGFHVPAQQASLPVFERIRADIGDHQSLQANLSTFSSHVLRLQQVLQEAGAGTLVLLDELGASTDPAQGAALALAVLETFRRRGARVVATTHLDRLKAFAEESAFAENAAVEFDEKSLRPTFRLLLGLSGQSNALAIAERLGLDSSVVNLARSKMSREDLAIEGYLQGLGEQSRKLQEVRERVEREGEKLAQEGKRLLAEKEQDLRDQEQQREKRLLDLELEFSTALQQELRAVRDRIARDQLKASRMHRARALRAALRQKAATAAGTTEDPGHTQPPQPNCGVTVISLGQSGRFLGMEGKQAVVEIAGKRVQVSLSDLKSADRSSEMNRGLPSNVRFIAATADGVAQELNLVGQTVEEALSRVDKFLDRALLENHTSVRLIHGRGSGRLAKALQQFLKSHPLAATVRFATEEEGGAAITVVELR